MQRPDGIGARVLGLAALLVGALLLAALLTTSILGGKIAHKLDTWPSPSPAATQAPSHTAAPTRPVTPTSAATRRPTISARPTPAPNCSCCVLCATDQAYQCACCRFCTCAGQTSAALGPVTLNVIRAAETSALTPDASVAVNDGNATTGRIIVATTNGVAILNKATRARISETGSFYAGQLSGAQPWATWDVLSGRFFVTAVQVVPCAKRLLVQSPPAVAGLKCTGRALFGPQTFNLTGTVAAAVPFDGCSPITANVTGRIVLMLRGACLFATMVKTAQNAGAVGAIIYRPSGTIFDMSGTDPSIVIPSLLVGTADGVALGANLPAVVTMSSAATTSYSSQLFISVSKDAAPNSRADFWHYGVANLTYAAQLANQPRHTADTAALYVASEILGDQTPAASTCVGANVRAFAKPALLAGTGAPTLWNSVIPGAGIDNPLAVVPAAVRTPIADQLLPALFVGTNTGNQLGVCDPVSFVPTPVTDLHIFTANAAGLLAFVGVVPLPTPMTFGACTTAPPTAWCTTTPTARQPPPAVPAGLATGAGRVATATVRNSQLWVALTHNRTAAHSVVRWLQIDAAPIALGQAPTLVQWGDVDVGADIDTFLPQIDVDAAGTAALLLYASGAGQPVVAAYTFRLAADAPGAMRAPLHTAVPNNYTYYDAFDTAVNAYGLYAGLQLDPFDQRTFYALAQRPDAAGFFDPPGIAGNCTNASSCVARDWTADLFAFDVRADTCPTDGIATAPAVLPSAAAAELLSPTLAGPLSMHQTAECVFRGIQNGYACL